MGVVFRVNGPQNLYRFTVDWERGVSLPRFRLIKRRGTAITLLDELRTPSNAEDLVPSQMPLTSIEVILEGHRIRINVGGDPIFDVTDNVNPIETGAAFGFYNWRTSGSFFTVPAIPLVEYGNTVPNQNCAVLEVQTIGTGEGTVSTTSVQPPDGAGQPIGVVTVPGSPAVTYPAGTEVSLTAVEAEGFSFDGWDGDARCSPGGGTDRTLVVAEDLQCQVKFGGTSEPVVNLDIDGDGDVDQIDAAVLQRGLFGLEGAALIEPILEGDNPLAPRRDPQVVKAYIDAGRTSVFDPDGNGEARAMADANLVIQRYVAWKQGGEIGDITQLIHGVVDQTPGGRVISNDALATAQAIVGFLNQYYPSGPQALAAVGDTQGAVVPSEVTTETGIEEPIATTKVVRVLPSQDSTLMAHHPHRNVGAHPLLQVGGRKRYHAVLQFALPSLMPEQLVSAQVVLTPYHGRGKDKRRHRAYPSLEVVPLTDVFVEGNGRGGKGRKARGSGVGVTWACAVDNNIGNTKADCAQQWAGGTPINDKASPHLSLEFDQTAKQYRADVTTWLRSILTQPNQNFAIGVLPAGRARVSFYAHEAGASDDSGNPRAPYLLIQTKEGQPLLWQNH